MNMKAVTFASLMAVSLAGTACSQQAPDETDTASATSEASAPKAGEFNLRYPTTSASETSETASGEFNLRVPGSSDMSADGEIRLPDGAVRENALSGVEELRTPDVATPPVNVPEEDPDDEIVRLDP